MRSVRIICQLKKLERRLKNKLFFQVAKYSLLFLAFVQGLTLLLVFSLGLFKPLGTWLMLSRWVQEGYRPDYRPIAYDDMSMALKKATITAEDHRFMYHHGFDFKAMERAERKNIRKKSSKRPIAGASTLSQQVAKNVFLWPGRSYIRKALEMYFTVLIESYWSKRKILETYLNVAELGKGIYGSEAASRHYFKKSASKLNQREASALASILPSPLKWSPLKPNERVRRRLAAIRKYQAFARVP